MVRFVGSGVGDSQPPKGACVHQNDTPARQNNNQQLVKFNLELTRKHSRKYPEISVGDTVRVYKKTKLDKERVSNYLPKNIR